MPVKVRYIEFSPDEWLAGTAMLTDQERGIYWQACALIYSRGGPIEIDVLRASCKGDVRPFKRCLDHLLALGKLQRFNEKLMQKRCELELERARKRSASSSENGRKGGRPLKKTNGLAKPDGLDSARAPANEKLVKPDASSSELAGLTAGDTSPLAAARGDGAAPPANQKPEPTVFEDPALKAEAIAALGDCIAVINGKTLTFDANGVRIPPDPRIVVFRARLQRLNTLAGERLRGGARIEAWDVIGRAGELGDPLLLPPAMLADLDAIESLEPCAEAAE